MNSLQSRELELLRYFTQICDMLNLRYYLVCGSALGAVKYGGFIPWDDDLDVALCRDDYEKLLREAPKYMPDHLFLQNYRTDPEFPCIYSKLRDSNTTYIEKSVSHLDIHHGVYIDVFPLDGYPEDVALQRNLEFLKKIYKLKFNASFSGEYSLKTELIVKILRIFGVQKRSFKTAQQYEKLISQYPTRSSSIWCNHGNWQGRLEYAVREQYGDGLIMKFEGLDVRVPQRYDEYLTQKYGDWRADLPPEQQIGHHYYVISDINRPYTEYIEKLPNGSIRVLDMNG